MTIGMTVDIQELMLLLGIPVIILIIYILNRIGFSIREGPPIELDKLKDRSNKLNNLLEKLEERFTSGEISEEQYKQLSSKYKKEIDNIKNKTIEQELIYDTKIEPGDTISRPTNMGGTIFTIGLILILVGYIAPNLQADLFNINLPYSLNEADKFCKASLGEIGKAISIEVRNACGNVSIVTGIFTAILIIGIGLMLYGIVEKFKK